MSIPQAIRTGEYAPSPRNYPNRARLRRYFKNLLSRYEAEISPCLFLPSFPELARELDCSMLDVHCALRELCAKGYDYFSLGLHSPITLWHPSGLALETPCSP